MVKAALCFLLGCCLLAAAAAANAPRGTPSRPAAGIKLGGVDYLELDDVCARFGLKPVSANSRRIVYKSEWTTLAFDVDSRDHEFNGLRVFTGEAVRSHRGRFWISRIDADALLTPLLRPGTNQARIPALKTIVLDPGHGGRDPGKVNPRVKVLEKDIALDTAKRARALLEARGYTVHLTRDDDRYLELSDRAEIAAKFRPDLFVAIHFNSVESRADQVTGVEVFSLTPQFQYSTADAMREGDAEAKAAAPANRFDHWNTAAAYALHRELIGTLGASDRGLKRARWKVLVLAPCPAAYVEGGYLSNDAEARKLATPAYRQKVAEGIARGVQAYGAALQRIRDRS